MRTGVALPMVAADASLADAVVEMSGKGMGMTAVVDAEQRVAGIFTDGDLRRSLSRVRDFSVARVADLMTPNPRTIAADLLALDRAGVADLSRAAVRASFAPNEVKTRILGEVDAYVAG
jgi:arabinose-5-phosphate isomerase